MAQNTGAIENTPEIDLDDIEVTILIVAKAPKNLTSTATFLTRRGWPTTAVSSLSQAIEFASDKKPDFVLISVNHPSPSIAKFPDLLSGTFGTTCIAFTEGSDTTSNSKLAKSKIALKIPGQPSGPSLHRSIRKILADRLNINIDDKAQSASAAEKTAAAKDKDKASAGGSAAEGQTVIQKAPDGTLRHKAPTLIKGEDETVGNGKYTMGKKNRRSLKDISPNAQGETAPTNATEVAARLKKSLFGDNPAEADVGGERVDGEGIAGPNPKTWLPANEAAAKKGAALSDASSPGQKKPILMPESTQAAAKKTPMAAVAAALGDANSAKPVGGEEEAQRKASKVAPPLGLAAVGPHSLIESAVKAAMLQVCRPASGDLKQIEFISDVGVFPIDSPVLPGYLVLAWPNFEGRAQEAFFKQAQQVLHSVFVEMGIQARLEQGFFVSLPQVEYATWASENATFSFSTVNGEQELGVAFFKTNKPIPKPRAIEDKNMYSIGVENISTEEPVNFKVYLHMKKNKKYFLYLRNGRQLQAEQKERLNENQVKDFYMKTIDAENLRMFLATAHLKQKIKKGA